MNTNELNIAYKVRHALNENLDNLPSPTLERLASARHMAVSRKKSGSALRGLISRNRLATSGGGAFNGSLPWIARMGLALPVIVLVAGLAGIYQVEQQRRISETAEIDAGVLSDELPLSAYLDHGFNAFLANRGD